MKIGILGSGEVAKALAGGFLKHGHEVMMGTRDAAKLAEWTRHQPKVRTGSVEEAAQFGELVVLAVKGSAAANVLQAAGRGAHAQRKDRHRYHKSNCRRPAHEWRIEILH